LLYITRCAQGYELVAVALVLTFNIMHNFCIKMLTSLAPFRLHCDVDVYGSREFLVGCRQWGVVQRL
jgi:hypothetical protein